MKQPIIFYTSDTCPMSKIAESFFAKYAVDAQMINISRNKEAHARVVELNDGFASVPTFIFPDGEQLTEPSIGRLADKLGIKLTFTQKLLASVGL